MKFIAHKNDGKGLIDVPVILIAESEITPLSEMLEGIPQELEPIVIEEDEIPDNSYIRAWVLNNDNKKIEIDMIKARDVVRKRIRFARERHLQKLDVEFQRALETNQNTEEIVNKKQVLRDAPEDPRIDAAQTVEELESLWESMNLI